MLELEARAEPSRLMSWLSPLLAVVLMLGGGLLVFSALGKDPIEGFRVFFLNPLKDVYSLLMTKSLLVSHLQQKNLRLKMHGQIFSHSQNITSNA